MFYLFGNMPLKLAIEMQDRSLNGKGIQVPGEDC